MGGAGSADLVMRHQILGLGGWTCNVFARPELDEEGEVGRDETIVFWHTGGSVALFAYPGQLLAGAKIIG